MKKTVVHLSLLVFLLCLFLSSAHADTQVFAFEDAEYAVLVGKTLKPKTVAQGIKGKLTYTWDSSNDDVATVKKGTVKGVAGGTATITCTATNKEGTTFTASCIVNVNIPIKSITTEKKTVEVALAPIGASMFYKPETTLEITPPYMYKPVITFTPSNASNQTLKWSSADPRIAEVTEDGTIFGVRSGTTTVTGKATDGSGKKVQIKVKVPACYVTEDNITITDPAGVEIGYIQGASSSGFSSYNIVTTGKVITFEPLDEANGMDWLRIIPLKAGKGTLSFTLNGRKTKTIKITVKHSAVFDNVSYPATKISTLIKSPDSSIGTKTNLKCEIIDIVPCESLGYRGGIIYALVKENGKKQYAIFEYEYATLYKVGDTQTIYGTLSNFVDYVTDTGLTYTCPYFVDGHINR